MRMGRVEWALLAFLSVLWGGSFFAKVAVRELPPLALAVLDGRVLAAPLHRR